MTDTHVRLLRESDPANTAAPLKIVKATVAFPDDLDDVGRINVLLGLSRSITPLERRVFEHDQHPPITRMSGVRLSIEDDRTFRLSGVTPEIAQSNRDDLSNFTHNLSNHARTIYQSYVDANTKLNKIDFPRPENE